MKISSKWSLLALTLFAAFTVAAQDINSRFGKVSKKELEMKFCPYDTTADAMVLSKVGELRFKYNDEKGWQYSIEITKRIKIFNTEGKEYGNASIKVYDPVSGSRREVISGLKAFTYNLTKGSIEKTKLENDQKFETRLSDYRTEMAFAMPNVQEGSVIEYKFSLTSDYISNLYVWEFQEDIPVGFARYDYTIPERFTYNHSQVGNLISLERKRDTKQESFTYTRGVGAQSVNDVSRLNQKGSFTTESNFTRLIGRNIAALQDEPFINNIVDLPSRIESQLISYTRNGMVEQVATSYEHFNKTLLDSETFGRTIDKGGFASDKINTLGSDISPMEKAKALYAWIKNSITFNNVYGFGSSVTNKKLFNEGKGSVAGINLTLVSVLRAAGIEAHPIILSTRGHGIPHPAYPNNEDFNYAIAGIIIDGKIYYADASSKLPLGVLPSRCLNGKGYLVKKGGGQWVDLKSGAKESYTVQTDITLADEMIKRLCQVKFDNYALYREKGKLLEDKEEYNTDVTSMFIQDNVNVEIQDEDASLRWKVTTESDASDDIIYVNPIEYGAVLENPFKRDERFSNIDFTYGISRKVITNIEVPEGYEAELPEASAIGLPENGGRFIYSVQKMGNRITIMSAFTLKKTEFSSKEYPILKQFYQLMADKNNEPVVIKKI